MPNCKFITVMLTINQGERLVQDQELAGLVLNQKSTQNFPVNTVIDFSVPCRTVVKESKNNKLFLYIYDALKNGRSYRAEYEFKTKIKSFIIRGTMDAVFQNSDGTWTVLDYKTDLAPNPQIYYNQLACYKKTAADLFAGGDQNKVRCVLFFAESNQFVDISQEAQKALEGLSDEKIRNLIEKAEIL